MHLSQKILGQRTRWAWEHIYLLLFNPCNAMQCNAVYLSQQSRWQRTWGAWNYIVQLTSSLQPSSCSATPPSDLLSSEADLLITGQLSSTLIQFCLTKWTRFDNKWCILNCSILDTVTRTTWHRLSWSEQCINAMQWEMCTLYILYCGSVQQNVYCSEKYCIVCGLPRLV